MQLFGKRKNKMSIPEDCKDMEIAVEKSICTGEMTVGFKDPVSGKLKYAELARNEADVKAFKEKYGRE